MHGEPRHELASSVSECRAIASFLKLPISATKFELVAGEGIAGSGVSHKPSGCYLSFLW